VGLGSLERERDAMKEKMIEVIVASPPEREELVVQLFRRDGGQWGEIYRQDGDWWIDLYQQADGQRWQLRLEEVIEVLSLSLSELRQRLE
jgi:hypothetical protein